MNPLTNVKNLQKINERELQMGLTGHAKSWHSKYKDSAWIYVGGVNFDLTEGDLLCVFSQYGEIVNINLVRDKKTGKSRGFGFICYEDQRSTILAVDNLNGIKLCNRIIRVDHVENYRPPKDSDEYDELTKLLHEKGCAPEVAIELERNSEDHEQQEVVDQTPATDPKDVEKKAERKRLRKEKKRAKKAKKKEHRELKKAKKEMKRKLKAKERRDSKDGTPKAKSKDSKGAADDDDADREHRRRDPASSSDSESSSTASSTESVVSSGRQHDSKRHDRTDRTLHQQRRHSREDHSNPSTEDSWKKATTTRHDRDSLAERKRSPVTSRRRSRSPDRRRRRSRSR